MCFNSRVWAAALLVGAGLPIVAIAGAQDAAVPASTNQPHEGFRSAAAVIARGEALFAVQNYDAALAEFISAYSQLAGHPRQYVVLHNIAACHERMFRYDAALVYYRRYLAEGGPNAEDYSRVQSAIESLNSLLAELRVSTNVAADVWVDDRLVARAPGSVRLPPGKHVIELRAPFYEAVRREIYVTSASMEEQRFTLRRLSSYRGLHPRTFWIGTGLTLAALSTGAIFGATALGDHNAAVSRRRHDPFLNTAEDERAISRSSLAADLSFAGAALLGVSTIVVFFLTDWSGRTQPDPLDSSADTLRLEFKVFSTHGIHCDLGGRL